jgi:hypothetical protein
MRSFLAPSCWSLEVVKGGGGERLRIFFRISRTKNGPFSTAFLRARVSSPVPGLTFSPPASTSFAVNSGGTLPANRAVRDQYSSGTKESIAFSRSRMILTATDWTMPAESPLRTFFQRRGLRE